MSEGDKTSNRNPAQYGGSGIGPAQPRHPKSFTQSKVLSIISKNQQDQTQLPADQTVQPDAAQQAPKAEGTMRQMSLPVAPSGLSATAAEFVPKAMQKPQAQPANTGYQNNGYYYEGQEGDYVYDQEGTDYYLGNNFGELTLEDTYDTDQPYYSSNYSQASIEERFDLALKILTTNPSNHEEYLKPICDEIVQTSAYDKVIPIIVENLYGQCIQEENFRYIGARVCQYLNSTLKMDPIFIKRFVNRCKVDFDKREELLSGSAEDKKRLQGLAMLLAEIFLNVETTSSDGTPQRLGFLPSILIKILQTLLSKQEDATVKCGCQMLKLSGSLLEDVVKNNPEDCLNFEKLFDSLKGLSGSSQLSENAKSHVDRIAKLKDNGWDTPLPDSTAPAYNPYAQNDQYYSGVQQQDPVYYDSPSKDEESGGHLLTEEEEEDFLAWQQSCQYDGYKSDSDMGFEMEEAYEEFLKQQAPSDSYSYQGPKSGGAGGHKGSSSVSANPTGHQDRYHYYSNQTSTHNHQQMHHQHHQQPQQHAHYGGGGGGGSGGGGGGFYPAQESHYQQQQPQYHNHYEPQYQQPQQYASNQYNNQNRHHQQQQQMPQQHHHQQQQQHYNHPRHQQPYQQSYQQHQQQQHPQQQQQQQQHQPYSTNPQNDPYANYRR